MQKLLFVSFIALSAVMFNQDVKAATEHSQKSHGTHESHEMKGFEKMESGIEEEEKGLKEEEKGLKEEEKGLKEEEEGLKEEEEELKELKMPESKRKMHEEMPTKSTHEKK